MGLRKHSTPNYLYNPFLIQLNKTRFPIVSFLLDQEQLRRKHGVIYSIYAPFFLLLPKHRERSEIDLKLIKQPTPCGNKFVFNFHYSPLFIKGGVAMLAGH